MRYMVSQKKLKSRQRISPVVLGASMAAGLLGIYIVFNSFAATTTEVVTPAAVGSVSVAAVGDMNPDGNISTSSPSGKNAAGIAAALSSGEISAFLGLGDFQYSEGNCSRYVNYWKKLWGPVLPKTYWVTGPRHDWEPGRNADLDDFMNGQCAGSTTKSAINAQRGFIENGTPYSFDLGNWHFAALSTALWRYDTTRAKAATTWLDADLAAAKAAGRHLAVIYHDPYFTSSTNTHNRETAVKPWIDVMWKHRVKLTLSGSQHNYERSCPINNADQCVSDGMTAFNASTGGTGLRSFTSSPSYIVKRFSDTYGWLKLTLNDDGSFSWQFKPVSGSGTDSGTRGVSGTTAPTPTATATPVPSPTPTPSTGLAGDINSDGKVNIFDLSILLSNWGKTTANCDLNKDGTVNVFDLSVLLSRWTA